VRMQVHGTSDVIAGQRGGQVNGPPPVPQGASLDLNPRRPYTHALRATAQ
jgi:hypothetical protein